MAGGLLNLIAIGNQNIMLTGNPTKSFFKTSYAKYTNFGMQKFRIDQIGQTNLHLTQSTHYRFEISRYGDLLMDTYLVVKLPNIWSPILKYINPYDNTQTSFEYRPYEFQWIKNIGSQLIEEVTYTIDGRIVQKYSGKYIQNIVERDFDRNKKDLFDKLTGNVSELNNPSNYGRRKYYPNAWKRNDNDISGIEPSIHEYTLYIPLNSWFMFTSHMAFPLISLQKNVFEINFKLRPIQQLFTIKNVIYDISTNPSNIYVDVCNNVMNNMFENNYYNYNNIPRIVPQQNIDANYAYYRFIQQPPVRDISSIGYLYPERRTNINYDVHLITTQCFLDTDERRLFIYGTRDYLLKEVKEHKFEKINKSTKVKIESNGLISSWMWYFQRDDVGSRNEWSNYTNWEYEDEQPRKLEKLMDNNGNMIYYNTTNNLYNFDISQNIYITGESPTVYEQTNRKLIMRNFGILVDGKYREDTQDQGIYHGIEKYNRNNGLSKDGIYVYNFALENNPYKYQPSGAFNTNKFRNVELEFNIYENPPIDLSNVNFTTICDPETGEVIATSKEPTSIYKYNYNLHVFEEKYNILRFFAGMADFAYIG